MRDLNALPLDEVYAEFRATGLVRRVLELARDEDLGPRGIAGDVTSAACGGSGVTIEAEIVPRQSCVAAGLAAMTDLVDVFGGGMEWMPRAADGSRVEARSVMGTVRGRADAVLALERTALNLLSRLCGIATHAHAMKAAMDSGAPGHRTVLLDTRKTTPGLRVLEKYAVRCGGCLCHRIGLFDAVLIKDNHLAGVPIDALAGFVRSAAVRARATGPVRFVEVEVDSLAQLAQVLTLERGVVDIVLVDNMDDASLREAVAMRDRAGAAVLLEASGGVSMDRVAAIARTGVDRISAGSLTHGARIVDIGADARTI